MWNSNSLTRIVGCGRSEIWRASEDTAIWTNINDFTSLNNNCLRKKLFLIYSINFSINKNCPMDKSFDTFYYYDCDVRFIVKNLIRIITNYFIVLFPSLWLSKSKKLLVDEDV